MDTKEQRLVRITESQYHNPYVRRLRPRDIPCQYENYEVFPGCQIILMAEIPGSDGAPSRRFDAKDLAMYAEHFRGQGYYVFIDGMEELISKDYLRALIPTDQKIITCSGCLIAEKPALIDDLREAEISTVGINYDFDVHGRLQKCPIYEAKIALDIAKLRFRTRVITTVTKPYLEKLPEYCEWCASNGYPEILFKNFIQQSNARELDDLILTAEDRKRYFEIITSLRAKYPIETLRISSSGSFGACGTANMCCTSMRDSVVLTPDLKIYPCTYMMQKGMECGYYMGGYIYTLNNFNMPKDDCLARTIYNG